MNILGSLTNIYFYYNVKESHPYISRMLHLQHKGQKQDVNINKHSSGTLIFPKLTLLIISVGNLALFLCALAITDDW